MTDAGGGDVFRCGVRAEQSHSALPAVQRAPGAGAGETGCRATAHRGQPAHGSSPGTVLSELYCLDNCLGTRTFLPVLRIRDVSTGSDFFPSRIQIFPIPDPHQRILTPKNGFQALKNIIQVVHPGSGSQIQGSKRHRIRNTAFCSGSVSGSLDT
jgi:hypothetical protein